MFVSWKYSNDKLTIFLCFFFFMIWWLGEITVISLRLNSHPHTLRVVRNFPHPPITPIFPSFYGSSSQSSTLNEIPQILSQPTNFFRSLCPFLTSPFLCFFLSLLIHLFRSFFPLRICMFHFSLKKSFNWKNVVTKLSFPLKANFWYSFVMFSLEKLFRNKIRFSILATLSKLGCWKTERGVKFEGKMDDWSSSWVTVNIFLYNSKS